MSHSCRQLHDDETTHSARKASRASGWRALHPRHIGQHHAQLSLRYWRPGKFMMKAEELWPRTHALEELNTKERQQSFVFTLVFLLFLLVFLIFYPVPLLVFLFLLFPLPFLVLISPGGD